MKIDAESHDHELDELVSCYFEMKIAKAINAGDSSHLNYLLAAQSNWEQHREISPWTGNDIAAWVEEVQQESQRLIDGNPRRKLLLIGRSGGVILVFLWTVLIVGNALTCVFDGWSGLWLNIPLALFAWFCILHDFTINRRKDS